MNTHEEKERDVCMFRCFVRSRERFVVLELNFIVQEPTHTLNQSRKVENQCLLHFYLYFQMHRRIVQRKEA